MYKVLLVSCLFLSLINTSYQKNDEKSSSIYETESNSDDDKSFNSGISESGFSDAHSRSEKFTQKKRPAPNKKSTKFPLQYKATVSAEEEESIQSAQVKGKKVYKDVGFRKKKLEKAIRKEFNRDTTTNPNKKKSRSTAKTKRRYTGTNIFKNTSDLNFPTDIFTLDPSNLSTINLDKIEQHLDRSQASALLNDIQEKYLEHRKKNDIRTGEDSMDITLEKVLNGTTSDVYSDLSDEYYAHGKTASDQDKQRKPDENKPRKPLNTEEELKEKNKMEHIFKELRSQSNRSITSRERAENRKIMLDKLRELTPSEEVSKYANLLDASQAEVLKKKYESSKSKEKMFVYTEPIDLGYKNRTRSPLHSIEQAYSKALREQGGTINLPTYPKEAVYKREKIEVTYRPKSSKEIERKKRKKEKKLREKENREPTTTIAGKQETKPFERRRPSSRERRNRYDDRDRYRDRNRGYSRERYRGRYDSRPRYSRERYRDRYRYDSRERYRPRDRNDFRRRDSRQNVRDDRRRDFRDDRRRDFRDNRRRDSREERRRDSREERRRDSRERQDRRYTRRKEERQSKKKWYSVEKETRRAFGEETRVPQNRAEGMIRAGGRGRYNREKLPQQEDSFERDFEHFAANDKKNSQYEEILKKAKDKSPKDSDIHI